MVSEQTSQEETLGDYIRSQQTVLNKKPGETDDPFSVWDDENPIFKDSSVLQVSYVPEMDRIVGRDEEISELARRLEPVLEGGGQDAIHY